MIPDLFLWFPSSFYDSRPLFMIPDLFLWFSTSFYDSRPLSMLPDLFLWFPTSFYDFRPLFLFSTSFFKSVNFTSASAYFLLDGSGSRYKHCYSVIKLKKIVLGKLTFNLLYIVPHCQKNTVKGTVSRDFRPLFWILKKLYLGPTWTGLKLFRKILGQGNFELCNQIYLSKNEKVHMGHAGWGSTFNIQCKNSYF